jgi:anti-anti-sigma regulatory factor
VLKADKRKIPDEVVILCSGQFTSHTSEQIEHTVRGLVPTSKRVVLDFGAVNNIENAALGSIVALYLSSKRIGCQLIIRNMPSAVVDLLSMWPEDAFETEKSIPTRPQPFRTNT